MKKLLALAVFMAALGAIGALVALRILSRPRVAPAPFGPEAPLPAPSELAPEEMPDDVRFADEDEPEGEGPPAPGAPGSMTESGVVLPEEVLTEERDEGMPAPLAAVAEPMGTLERDLPPTAERGRNGAAATEGAPAADVTDEQPWHHTPPPVSEVVGEPPGTASDIADTEPSHVPPPPVSEVTGEEAQAAIDAEDALASPVTGTIAHTAQATETADEGDFLSKYFDDLASSEESTTIVVEEIVVAETVTEPIEEEPLPAAIEEALATLPGQNIARLGQRDAESYLDEGNVYFNVGQYGLAIERYGKAIELSPELIAAHYNRANARTRAGDYEGALADYNEALRLQPNDPDALNNRGMLHLYRATYGDALRDFNAALAIDPADTTVMVNRGLAHLHGGDAAAALVDFREASSLDSNDAAAHYGAGQAAATLANREEALRHITRALELDPAYAREAAADPRLQTLQGDEEFMRLLRESGSRAERP